MHARQVLGYRRVRRVLTIPKLRFDNSVYGLLLVTVLLLKVNHAALE